MIAYYTRAEVLKILERTVKVQSEYNIGLNHVTELRGNLDDKQCAITYAYSVQEIAYAERNRTPLDLNKKRFAYEAIARKLLDIIDNGWPEVQS